MGLLDTYEEVTVKLLPKKPKDLLRHIVKLDENGEPLDQYLCGHIWDKVFLKHGESICQDCVDELRKSK